MVHHRPLMFSLATLAAAALLACGDASNNTSGHFTGVGGKGDASTDGPSSSSDDSGSTIPDAGTTTTNFAVATDKGSVDVELRNQVTVQVTVTPAGFTGTVTLGATGLAAGVTAAFAPPTVDVSGTTGATSVLTLTTKSDVAPGVENLKVTGTSGSDMANAALALNVQSILTVTIPANLSAVQGTQGNPSHDAYGDYPIVVTAAPDLTKTPAVIKFYNADATPHCIHASNANQGFPHDPEVNGQCAAPMQQGEFDSQAHNINTKGSYTFYLHDQGDLTEGQIKVQ